MKTTIVQITAGNGPAECCWVVSQVLKYFIVELKEAKITYTELAREAGIKSLPYDKAVRYDPKKKGRRPVAAARSL